MASASATPARCAPPVVASRPWKHRRTSLFTAAGDPHHGASDPITVVGEDIIVRGKLAYGKVSKDLEDEAVVLMRARDPIDPKSNGACPVWQREGVGFTDADGRVSITSAAPSTAGAFPFALVVPGDGSSAEGVAWVLPSGQRIVVFDIDGTLTQGDEALFEQLMTGYSPPPRSSASAVAQRLAAGGASIVYITGRPDIFAGLSRAWLTQHGFPRGPVELTATRAAAMPSEDGVQQFKLTVLEALRDKGLVIERAYGNAVTDICAYAKAGIPPDETFIAGRHGGEACEGGAATQALGENYDAHLSTLR